MYLIMYAAYMNNSNSNYEKFIYDNYDSYCLQTCLLGIDALV